MNFSIENDEIVNKLDRILGTCSNIRDNIDLTIKKLNIEEGYDIVPNLNSISMNLNSVMKSAEPFFKYYLVIPNNTDRDDGILYINTVPMMLNTNRSESLVKTEAKLLESSEKKENDYQYDLSINNMITDEGSSGGVNSLEHLNTVRYNTNKLSQNLSEKLKELSRSITKPYLRKEDSKKGLINLNENLQNAKAYLNKR
jgi:hypothetical protein